MSAADVELVRRSLDRLAVEGYEAFLTEIHPEFEMETLPGLAAEPQVYRGPEGVRRWWESFYEFMDEIALEADALHDAGDGAVVVEFTLRATGRASGVEAEQRACMLCRLRGELLIGIEFFPTPEEALAAAR